MVLARHLILAIGFSSILANTGSANTEEFTLPNLGESSTSMFSSEFEYQLGRAWLRAFRGQVPTIDDPLLFDYVENLIYMLYYEQVSVYKSKKEYTHTLHMN